MCFDRNSAGVHASRAQSAAAVPAACPVHAQVAITRVEVNAMCEFEMLRPAISKFPMFLE